MHAPRHILILIHSLGGGGAERVSVNLAATWAAAGDRVTIATLKGPEPIPYDLAEGVRLLPLDVAGDSSGPLGALIANFRRVRRVRRLLREERPDVAIGMMTNSAIYLALARDGRALTIGSERIYPPLEPIGRLWEILRRKTYGRLDIVVAQTSEVRDWILKNTGARRVAVIPNSIHLPLPERAPALRPSDIVPPSKKTLLSVGRLASQKGFHRLLSAFAAVSARHPDWRLVILGEGPLRPALEDQIDALGLREQVVLPGWAGNLAEWYRAADVCAMSSLHEGFPNVLLEAMAHGCAVVSVDCDTGPRDLVENEVNGLLVPQDDPKALSAALDTLMGDEALRVRLGREALAVRETYSPEKIDARWQQLFGEK